MSCRTALANKVAVLSETPYRSHSIAKETMKKDTKRHEETRKRSCSRSPKPKVELKKEEVVNYDIPSRQFGDLYCVLCDSHMNSEQMWENHIKGKRHLKKRNLPIFRFRKKILGKYARPCGSTPLARKLADSSSTDESTLYQQALQG
ncbi:hypothetical protein AVEN_53271-1 [Araneus ventricosus]|uniref:U1-type domain-containing protein n=1 Tax=Araneus ventricosus TaxID=182803 RepID=A0A4Y2A9J6_ARAVE|nr:hypothetical protein AVEN_53271-1 [Araneus ventricosus]